MVTSNFGIRVTGGSGSIYKTNRLGTITGPASGSFFFAFTTNNNMKFEMFQNLPDIVAGTSVDCGLFYNFPGDSRRTYDVDITLQVDGQLCGSATTSFTEGWSSLSPGTVVVSTDNPRVIITAQYSNTSGERIPLAFDDLSVVPTNERGLPRCAAEAQQKI
jgi:hypothetical protein